MAFFSLTQLGPQDPFHRLNSKDTSTPPCNDQSKSTKEEVATIPGTTGSSYSQPLPSFTSQLYGKTTSTAAERDQVHGGSFNKLSQMRTKHQRNEKGPMELYRSSMTSSSNYGWWIKETGHAPKWAEQDRHVHVNSEMTRYVDEMSLTNKDFSLF